MMKSTENKGKKRKEIINKGLHSILSLMKNLFHKNKNGMKRN